MTKYDAIVIGAGHNGLISATYLAKEGKRVLVLDGRATAGGCASTKAFSSGFHVSDCAQWLHQFDNNIIKELNLEMHGLRLGQPKRTLALQATGDHLVINGDSVKGGEISPADKKAFKHYKSQMRVFATLMLKLYRKRAPKMVEANRGDQVTLLSLGLGLKMMGRKNMQDMMPPNKMSGVIKVKPRVRMSACDAIRWKHLQ
ncbi:FAD-dependent oxidoreductase [Luminiphilus sp.]|nr:FAD-dependent oxidoreductase [Luminiphilus sp.]